MSVFAVGHHTQDSDTGKTKHTKNRALKVNKYINGTQRIGPNQHTVCHLKDRFSLHSTFS